MKRRRLIIIATTFLLSIPLVNCYNDLDGEHQIIEGKAEFTIEAFPTKFEFSSEETAKKTITILSNTKWKITRTYGWCQVSEYSGYGDKTLTVSCDNNKTNYDRTDTLCIKTDFQTIKIPVFQSSSDIYIVPVPSTLNYPAEGGSRTVYVQSNIEWIFKLLHDIGDLKRDGNNLTLSLLQNNTADIIYDTIVIEATGYKKKEIIPVRQEGLEPFLSFIPDSLNNKSIRFTNDGGNFNFTIQSNLKWTLSCNSDWCHITSDNAGNGNGTISLQIDPNPVESKSRNSTITVKTSYVNKDIHIRQDAGEKGYIRTTPDEITLDPLGGNVSIKVESNLNDWSVVCKSNWCTLQNISGKYDGTINLVYEENNLDTPRDAVIIIKSIISDVTIKLLQDTKATPGSDDNPNPYYSNKR